MALKLVFGAVRRDDSEVGKKPLERFARALSEVASIDVQGFEAATYAELAAGMVKGDVDVAWLPPIPFIALEGKGVAEGLVSQRRAGRAEFHSVLIVSAASGIQTLEEVQGTRAAWVDPYSASGYVVPRIELDARGIDPRAAFSAERFFRSHAEVVHALMEGRADVGATYGGVDASGTVTRGAWMEMPRGPDAIRVLEVLAAIPGDVIAARVDLPKRTRETMTRALIAIARDRVQKVFVRDLFGSEDFRRWLPAGYDTLRAQTAEASAKGMLEAEEHGYD
jgi:phosphate/phosphite/phosphonate ABC transporter binding protein